MTTEEDHFCSIEGSGLTDRLDHYREQADESEGDGLFAATTAQADNAGLTPEAGYSAAVPEDAADMSPAVDSISVMVDSLDYRFGLDSSAFMSADAIGEIGRTP